MYGGGDGQGPGGGGFGGPSQQGYPPPYAGGGQAAYQGQHQQPPHPPGPQRYQFTTEEIRVLKECNRESFWYRSVPFGTLLGVGAYYAVRNGYLKPSARFGAGPKMFIGSVVGYVFGKVSYRATCVEKLMNLPNSPLADMLRDKKGRLGFQEGLTLEPGFASTAPVVTGEAAFADSEFGSSGPRGSFTDVGDTRPMASFDTVSSSNSFATADYGKYDTTQQMLNDDNLPTRKSTMYTTSYDELRKQNRDDYERRVHGGGGPMPLRHGEGMPSVPDTRGGGQMAYPLNERSPPPGRGNKNIYGDAIWGDDKSQ